MFSSDQQYSVDRLSTSTNKQHEFGLGSQLTNKNLLSPPNVTVARKQYSFHIKDDATYATHKRKTIQPRTTPRQIQPHKRRRNNPANALTQRTRQRRRRRRTTTQTIASTQQTTYPTTRKRSIKLRPTRKQHHHKGC